MHKDVKYLVSVIITLGKEISGGAKEKNLTKYWSTLKLKPEKAKKILPSTCRIGETIFTSMAAIGGKLYRNHPKNLNHMHNN